MAQMLDAYRDYFRAIRESYIQPDASFEGALVRTRQAARGARSNREASFGRMRAEPATTARDEGGAHGHVGQFARPDVRHHGA